MWILALVSDAVAGHDVHGTKVRSTSGRQLVPLDKWRHFVHNVLRVMFHAALLESTRRPQSKTTMAEEQLVHFVSQRMLHCNEQTCAL